MSAPTNPVVVVTGAGAGIGRATSLHLARRGWTVAAVDIDKVQVDSVVAEINGEGLNARSYVCDVSDEDAVTNLIADIVSDLGEIAGLFNNVGIEGDALPLGQYPAAKFRRVMEINVMGVFIVLNAVIPSMLRRGGGAVVNTASTASFKGFGKTATAYVASKHAVLGITRETSVQMSRTGIRINAVAPGFIETALADRVAEMISPEHPEEIRNLLAASIPDGRYGTPEEVAGAVAFLLSDEATHITGAVLAIDGGELAQ